MFAASTCLPTVPFLRSTSAFLVEFWTCSANLPFFLMANESTHKLSSPICFQFLTNHFNRSSNHCSFSSNQTRRLCTTRIMSSGSWENQSHETNPVCECVLLTKLLAEHPRNNIQSVETDLQLLICVGMHDSIPISWFLSDTLQGNYLLSTQLRRVHC